MKREDAIRKIRKLLNASIERGSTEGEVQAHSAAAQRLMLEYAISGEELRSVEREKEIVWVERVVWWGNGWPWQLRYVAQVTQEFFFVRVLYRRSYDGGKRCKLVLFGDEENVEVAALVVKFLMDRYKILWRDQREKYNLKHRHARGFYEGLRDGLFSKLSSDREEFLKTGSLRLEGEVREDFEAATEGAIIVRTIEDKLEDEFRERYPKLRTQPPGKETNKVAYQAGVRKGKELDIKIDRPAGKLEGQKGIED